MPLAGLERAEVAREPGLGREVRYVGGDPPERAALGGFTPEGGDEVGLVVPGEVGLDDVPVAEDYFAEARDSGSVTS